MKRIIVILVTLTAVSASFATPIVYNASFEAPSVTAETWEPTLADQGGTGWDFFNGGFHAGVVPEFTFFANWPAVEGSQMGTLWVPGDEIAQTIGGFTIGDTYTISWSERARDSYTGGLWVLMDSTTIDAAHAVSDGSWVTKSVEFTATSTNHRLRFFHSGDWDTMIHIDNITLIPNDAAQSPTPENGQFFESAAASIILGWAAGNNAVQHDVYFGTNATDVANATTADASGIYQGRQTMLSFDPGTLETATTYYWRVDEVDAGSGVVTGEIWSFVIAAELRDLYADTWVAVDGLDRVLSGVEKCGPPREDKLVFMFYLSWLGSHGTDGPYDLTKLLAANSLNPALGPRWSFHHWGEPEVGYYTSKDEWVMRRHIQYLSDAGVDVLILDATNGGTYEEEYMLLCSVIRQLKIEGEKVPQIVFWTHSGSPATVTRLYNNFYSKGYYEDLWFYRDGKPLHLGFPDGEPGGPTASVSQEIRDFFTWREYWAWQDTSAPDKWTIDDYPQDYGWDISSDEPTQASVVVGSHATRNMGQSFHNFTSPSLDARGLSGTEGQGLMFQEHFDRVLQIDPDIVTVFRWNEWVAQRFVYPEDNPGTGEFLGNPIEDGESFFVDLYNAEFNSDIEPMKGGYTDNYYYQLIDYVRQYKGVRTPPPASHAQTISMDGDFSEWADVQPEFRDHVSDTTHRNCQGWGSAGIYTNTTGRNDLLNFKVARDASNIYFYAETAEPITSYTDPNWMLLFIDADQDHATGWEGYDYLVNHQINSPASTTLKQTAGGWNWTTASADISYKVSGNKIEICVPRSLIGQGSGDDPVGFDFHWADNIQAEDDIIEFAISGDSAPNRRFNYRYQTRTMVETTLVSDGFESGVETNYWGDWDITAAEPYTGAHSLECSVNDPAGLTVDVPTPGQESFRVSFKYRLQNVSDARVWYHDGTDWVFIDQIGTAEEGVWLQYTDVRYNSGDDTNFFNGSIAFHVQAGSYMSSSDQFVWIDDVEITGYSETEPTPPPAEIYATWAAGYGLDTNSTGAMTFDYEPDGLDNLLEYALGGNPTNDDAASILPTFGFVDAGGGSNFMEYIYNRRLDAAVRGLTYGLNESTNLLDEWIYVSNAYETGAADIDLSFESVTNAVPFTTDEGFIALEIEESF